VRDLAAQVGTLTAAVFYNSNAAARELLERSELPTDKKPGGWTPGWSTELD
jgi:hypothetical protein